MVIFLSLLSALVQAALPPPQLTQGGIVLSASPLEPGWGGGKPQPRGGGTGRDAAVDAVATVGQGCCVTQRCSSAPSISWKSSCHG